MEVAARLAQKVADEIISECRERSTCEYFGHMRDFNGDKYFRNAGVFGTNADMGELQKVKQILQEILEIAATKHGLTFENRHFVFDVQEVRPCKRWFDGMRYQVHIQATFSRKKGHHE